MKLLNVIEKASGLPVRALQSNKLEQQIIYNIVPVSSNGVVRTDRLELNIIGFSLEEVERADKAIRASLLSIGDLKKNNVKDIYINGGGTLKDDAAIHRFINYMIIQEEKLNG